MKQLFEQVFIHSEADLPKEEKTFYIAHIKGEGSRNVTYRYFDNSLPDWWFRSVDWYLLPVEPQEPKQRDVTDDDIMLYFSNHCIKSSDFKLNYQVFTRGNVLEFAKWMRSQMTGK